MKYWSLTGCISVIRWFTLSVCIVVYYAVGREKGITDSAPFYLCLIFLFMDFCLALYTVVMYHSLLYIMLLFISETNESCCLI